MFFFYSDERNSLEYKSGIDFVSLRVHFIERQKSQRAQRLIQRKRSVITPDCN